MASARKSKTEPETDTNKAESPDKQNDKQSNKILAKKATEPAKVTTKEDKAEEEAEKKPVIKKRRAVAQEIDKAQAKRLVRVKRTTPIKRRKIVKAVKPVIKARDIGVEVSAPEEGCNDPACPFHGTLSVRGQILNGVVVSSKMDKTAIVQREIKRFIPKYERFEKRTHNYAVHNPPCLNVQRGDIVKIMECRPLSKSKSFVVIEKL